jgi:hypothetical protein
MTPELKTGRASEGGHWYDRAGNCVYQIRGANGAMRDCTLRDARKLGLVPGFSSIAHMEHKPMLVRWQIDQALMSAITLPRVAGESDDSFCQRAREDSQAQSEKARNLGVAIHADIERVYRGELPSPDHHPHTMGVKGYLKQRFGEADWNCERSFAHALGYGGKVDLSSAAAVIDFKCKDFGPEKTCYDLAWPEQAMQLAAYREGLGTPQAACVNVFVSTRVPGLVCTREWDETELAEAWDAFKCLLRLWQIRRKYPCGFAHQAAA